MNILLICEAGASTGYLVQKMQAFIAEHEKLKHKEMNVEATSVNQLGPTLEAKDIDVVLIAPQIRSREDSIHEVCEHHQVKVSTIDLVDYGRIDAPAIIKLAIKLYKS
ncbi:PTS sugar transporter subunit IIB [Oceanobacillus sp. FSL W8-0428]|uniref:PTS sugar transporter subunit IIB n=1 Tax=Oceanobacillus sojae TaxID=582851 RepID=A0A511ZN17_9BACI|nr:PTS sugar transporter subunit IIB [Oceanobacillus sojae]GEN88841.1 PTS sugar transporter subunit IIB [Oceanobacillus sojae]